MSHHYCPKCGNVKVYDAQGVWVDVSRIAWCTCERDNPQPMRNPRAEIVGLILAFAWCIGWCVWFVSTLAR